MTWSETSGLRDSLPLRNAITSAGMSLGNTVGKALRFVFSPLQPCEVDMGNIKSEVWADLSAVYYKYEDEDQKKAFREVVHEISDKITEGRWNAIYKKLYRAEKIYTK
jgi:hypothetical protein